MFFSLPTIALAASLLSSSVLAAPHSGHRHLHAANKRDAVLVDRDVTEINTVTDWVTVWWDGTSFITPSATATSADAIQTQAAANEAANVNAAAEVPAPVTTAAPAATASPVASAAPVAPAAAVADTKAADAAAAAAAAKEAEASSSKVAAASSAAANAAASAASAAASAAASEAAKVAADAAAAASSAAAAAAAAVTNPAGIVGGVASIISSVVAPVIQTPTSVATPVATGVAKRGLAYNNADLASSFTGADSQVSWAYNWGSTTPAIPSAFEYVPMLWGTQAVHSDGWTEAANSAIASGSTHLLAFNEPDLPAQANLDVGSAAAGYKTFIQPFAGKAKLGSPAVTNGPAPMGLAYLKSFLAACDGCTIDFVPLHWYDAASNVDGFKSHITDMAEAAGGRKLWITEFGATGSTEEQEEFLRQVIPWLDSNDSVERYAYFYADGVLTQNSVLSALGSLFKSFIS